MAKKMIMCVGFLLFSQGLWANLCANVFSSKSKIVGGREKSILEPLLRVRQFATTATVELKDAGRDWVVYHSELTPQGVRITRESNVDSFVKDSISVLVPVKGALTIAAHPRLPGVFVVAKINGSIEFVSIDGIGPWLGKKKVMDEIQLQLGLEDRNQLLFWIAQRPDFFPEERVFEAKAMIEQYETVESAVTKDHRGVLYRYRPLQDDLFLGVNPVNPMLTIASLVVDITGEIYVYKPFAEQPITIFTSYLE